MQEVLIGAAMQAGAEVWRGVTAIQAETGPWPSITNKRSKGEITLVARLVVGADGRNSRKRALGGFKALYDPQKPVVSGMLLNNLPASEGAIQYYQNTK